MVRYSVYFNGELTKAYELDEPVIFIGRLPENHIPISNMGISRRHVKIELDPSGVYILSDLNSLNGTLVNGKKVKKAELQHGDKIGIGKYTVLYEDMSGGSHMFMETIMAEVRPEDLRTMAQAAGHKVPVAGLRAPAYPPPAPPPAPVPAAVPPPAAPLPAPAAAAPIPFVPPPPAAPRIPPLPPPPQAAAPKPAPAAQETAAGAVLIETSSHVVYRLDKGYLTIGSDEEDDIYASGFMVNKGFAAVEQRDGGYNITTQKVMAKIKVNGKSVRSHRLEHRDRIEIGSNTFRFMENG